MSDIDNDSNTSDLNNRSNNNNSNSNSDEKSDGELDFAVYDPVLDEPPISPMADDIDGDDDIAGDQGEEEEEEEDTGEDEVRKREKMFLDYRNLENRCNKEAKNIATYQEAEAKFESDYKEAKRITRKTYEDSVKAAKTAYQDQLKAADNAFKTNKERDAVNFKSNMATGKNGTDITDLEAYKKRHETHRMQMRQAQKAYKDQDLCLRRRRQTFRLNAKKQLSFLLEKVSPRSKSQKEKKKNDKARLSLDSRASGKSRKSKASTKSRVSAKSAKSSKSEKSRVSVKSSIGSITHDGTIKCATTVDASFDDDKSVDINVDVDVRVKESAKKAVGAVVRALSPKKKNAKSRKDLATCTVPEARAELLRLTGVIVQACDDNGNEMEHSMSFLAKMTVAKLDRALATLLGRGINKSSEMRDFWYFRNEATADEWPLKDYYTLCRGSLLLGPLPTRMNAGRKRMYVAPMFGFKKDWPCKALDKNKKNQDEWDRFEAERAARAE